MTYWCLHIEGHEPYYKSIEQMPSRSYRVHKISSSDRDLQTADVNMYITITKCQTDTLHSSVLSRM